MAVAYCLMCVVSAFGVDSCLLVVCCCYCLVFAVCLLLFVGVCCLLCVACWLLLVVSYF